MVVISVVIETMSSTSVLSWVIVRRRRKIKKNRPPHPMLVGVGGVLVSTAQNPATSGLFPVFPQGIG